MCTHEGRDRVNIVCQTTLVSILILQMHHFSYLPKRGSLPAGHVNVSPDLAQGPEHVRGTDAVMETLEQAETLLLVVNLTPLGLYL